MVWTQLGEIAFPNMCRPSEFKPTTPPPTTTPEKIPAPSKLACVGKPVGHFCGYALHSGSRDFYIGKCSQYNSCVPLKNPMPYDQHNKACDGKAAGDECSVGMCDKCP